MQTRFFAAVAMIAVFSLSLFLSASLVLAQVTTKKATLIAAAGEIETLTGTYRRSVLSSPVPFDLDNFELKESKLWGSLRATTRETGTTISGSVTILAKGYYSGIGTTRYLDASVSSNVKLNAKAYFNSRNSQCAEFSSSRIVCTTNSSKVYLFIPSHEDLKFFMEYPKNFTVEIRDGKVSVYADDILKITDFSVGKWKFAE